jgi:hypothetical protein
MKRFMVGQLHLRQTSAHTLTKDFEASPQIANPQILGLNLLSQIRKTENLWFIRKFIQNTALRCLKIVLNVFFWKDFEFELEHFMLY